MPKPDSVRSSLENISARVNALDKINEEYDTKLNLTTFHYLPAISGYVSDSPWVVDIYDDPSQLVFNNGIHHHFGVAVLEHLLNSAEAGLITLHPDFSQEYDFEKVYLMNGCSYNRITPGWHGYEKGIGSSDGASISAVWVGKTDIDQGMRILIESLYQTDAHVVVNVFGEPYAQSKAYAQEKGVDNAVHFHGDVSHEVIINHLREADVGLCILPRREDWLYSYPIKIGEYLSAGLIPVASDFPAINRLMGTVGFKIDPVPSQLSTVFEEISNLDSRERQKMYKNSRDRAEAIAWRDIRDEMVRGLKKVLSSTAENNEEDYNNNRY